MIDIKNLEITLEKYSGPLDLLLQLIQKERMNIEDINISQITAQYLYHLKKTVTPDLETAGEFIKMACFLMFIKSQNLIPPEEIEEEEEDPDVLKENLKNMLVVYQRYKKAGELLYSRPLLMRDVWPTSLKEKIPAASAETAEIEVKAEEQGFLLAKHRARLLFLEKKQTAHVTRVPLPSILSRLKKLAKLFTEKAQLYFRNLIKIHPGKYSPLLTFLSLLELSKMDIINLDQQRPFEDIKINVKQALTHATLDLFHQEEQSGVSEKLKGVSYEAGQG